MSENNMYIKVEHPVLYFTLNQEGLRTCFEDRICESISSAGKIGIDNVVIESNDIRQIDTLLLRLRKMSFTHTNVSVRIRRGLDLFQPAVENRLNSMLDTVSLSIGLSVEEIEGYIEKNLENAHRLPLIVTCNAESCETLSDSLLRMTSDKYDGAVIVKPVMDLQLQEHNHGMTWGNLDDLYVKLIEFSKRSSSTQYLMDYGFLPARLMNEHPCNGYVCSRHTCHSGKNNLPRRIYLNEAGDVLPEHPQIHRKYTMGSLYRNSIVEVINSYAESNQHKEFLQLARYTYMKWVQTTPYRVIPWSELIRYSSQILN